MNDGDRWTMLVGKLADKTSRGGLAWEEGSFQSSGFEVLSASIATTVLGSSTARKFKVTVGDTVYELSAGNAFGEGPYELKIWQKQAGRMKPVTALNSNVRLTDPQLGFELQRLHRLVDSSVERDDEIAERLSRELDQQ